MKVADNLLDLIGNTPLINLKKYCKNHQVQAKIFAKTESFNPAGSAKDRVGYAMISTAEEQGLITENTVIIEPTSGNTGIGLAMTAAIRGYRLILTMPESMSIERRKLLSAFGAEIVLTPAKEGMSGAIKKAQELAESYPDSFIPQQFENKSNPMIHRQTTGEEIWRDTDGTIDIFVAGVGTGGTISGVGEALKAHNPLIKIVAVEPEESAVISGKPAGTHGIQGIGAGFIPKIYNSDIVDEILPVKTVDAIATGKELPRCEGILCGISGGAALFAATELAARPENKDKTIVVLLPDSAERYLSTALFD